MSLKTFHIFFVTISIFLTIGFGVWEILGWLQGFGTLWIGMASLMSTVILCFYLRWFLEKLRRERTL